MSAPRRAVLLLALTACGKAAGPADAGDCETFDRVCTVSADCTVLSHQLDCCGSQREVGVASRSADAAQKKEDACFGNGPTCRCLARAPIAEDGQEVLSGANLGVGCDAGRCTTFVK